MRLTLEEKETIIVFNEKDAEATVYTCNEKLRNKLKKLEQTNDECTLTDLEDKYSARYIVPKTWIKVSPPKQYSEEQRAQMAERAKTNLKRMNPKEKKK